MSKKTVADLDLEEQELRSRLANISKERELAIKEQSLDTLDTQAKLSEAIFQNRYLIAALAGHPSVIVHDERECGICRLLDTESWQLPTQSGSVTEGAYGIDFFISVAAYERGSTRYIEDGSESKHQSVTLEYVRMAKPRFRLIKRDDVWQMADGTEDKAPTKRRAQARSRKVSK